MTSWLPGFETCELAKATVTCKNGPCQSCIAVAKINGEINQALATLRRLLTKRCELRSEQNCAHDLVHRLPVELKNHIFELLLPSRNEWGENLDPGSGVMPSYLASICRGWRDIAWSNPFLWSTMHIEIISSNSSSDPSSANKFVHKWLFVHKWFLRSQTLPLTIHVVNRIGSSERSNQVLYAVLDAMNQCSNRLQSLSLDIPHSILTAFQCSGFQWHRLTRLRVLTLFRSQDNINQPLQLLNPTASPEKLELCQSLKSLQISWNHLTSAYIDVCDLEDLAKLFQRALQLTDCEIFSLDSGPANFSMPPIIHHRLKKLGVHPEDWIGGPILLGSLTLPSLREFETGGIDLLPHLPALVHRSSCPLTRLALSHLDEEEVGFDDLQPLPGVTHLILENMYHGSAVIAVIKELLLEEYFPNLRHLTLRLKAFITLWDSGIIPMLLDRKRPRPDGLNEGRLDKILVVEQGRAPGFSDMWNSEIGEQLKALNVTLREDGFEFL